MPVDPTSLADDLQALAQQPATSAATAAADWADAMDHYTRALVPVVAPPAAALAADALEASLATAFATFAAAAAMELAFKTYAQALAAGMALGGFLGVAPPGQVGFAQQFATLPMPSTHAAAGAALAERIDTWLRTGTATPAAGGTAQAWA